MNKYQKELKRISEGRASDSAAYKAGAKTRALADKGLAFLKTTKAALAGDEASKETLAGNFANAAGKAKSALENAGAVAKGARKKIEEQRKNKGDAPKR